MKISLDGLLLRLHGDSGQIYAMKEFLKNFQEAKNAFRSGDKFTVKKFFEIYAVTSSEKEKDS